MHKRIAPALAVLALSVMVALPTGLPAQDALDRMGRRLEEISTVSAMQGYGLDEHALNSYALSGQLAPAASVRLVLHLWAGKSYRITGVCERACSDFDLRLHGAAGGGPVAEDTLADSVPLLEFTARETGVHLLTVEMRECSGEECYFGVRILSK